MSLGDKYATFKSFNQFVLKRSIDEINKYTSLHVEVDYIRARNRRVEDLEFHISFRSDDPNQTKLAIEDNEPGKSKHSGKKEPFNYEKFRKTHGRIVYQIEQKIRKSFQGSKPSKLAIENAVRNQCEQWYLDNA